MARTTSRASTSSSLRRHARRSISRTCTSQVPSVTRDGKFSEQRVDLVRSGVLPWRSARIGESPVGVAVQGDLTADHLARRGQESVSVRLRMKPRVLESLVLYETARWWPDNRDALQNNSSTGKGLPLVKGWGDGETRLGGRGVVHRTLEGAVHRPRRWQPARP